MIKEFNLLETCNAYIRQKKDEFKLRLSLDVQLPGQLVGHETGLCNSITQICIFLSQYTVNGIDIEIQKIEQYKRSIGIIVKVKGLCSHQAKREALRVISKDIDWLNKMPYKTSLWVLSDYLQFSFKMTFQCLNEDGHISNSFLNSKILLAEGNKMNALVLISYLEEWGCSVTHVNTGVEAVAVAFLSKFDLLILDIYMFEMKGGPITQNIRTLNSQTPLVMLAPFSQEYAANDLLFLDANDLLLKPVNKTQLFSMLAKYL
jgi:CheY-like chemotaxis protein